VIPKKNSRIVSLPRMDLIGALRRADIMAQDRAHPVCFSFSPGHLEVSSSNPDLGEVKEDIEADYKGETFQVGFNARYFLDVLAVIADEKIVLELGDELSPCMMRSEFDRGFLALVMPMRL
jgi:DNA polymerase-3 subunit beta